MLYLVATPIGNLQDISSRALDILRQVDCIYCEDTRHSQKLLNHFGIKNTLKSFHKFNERQTEIQIIRSLKEGKQVALISDAGTPGISDPGEQLVKLCKEEGISVSPIPGPCALIQALSGSGLNSSRFQFLGFVPRKQGEIKELLNEVLRYPGTSILYESPRRLQATLHALCALNPEADVVVARELTKQFEEFVKGTATTVLQHFSLSEIKGEIVLLIEGKAPENDWKDLTPDEHVAMVEKDYRVTKKEAIKIVAELRGLPKRQIYNALHTSD